jgi:hypothetical protein
MSYELSYEIGVLDTRYEIRDAGFGIRDTRQGMRDECLSLGRIKFSHPLMVNSHRLKKIWLQYFVSSIQLSSTQHPIP